MAAEGITPEALHQERLRALAGRPVLLEGVLGRLEPDGSLRLFADLWTGEVHRAGRQLGPLRRDLALAISERAHAELLAAAARIARCRVTLRPSRKTRRAVDLGPVRMALGLGLADEERFQYLVEASLPIHDVPIEAAERASCIARHCCEGALKVTVDAQEPVVTRDEPVVCPEPPPGIDWRPDPLDSALDAYEALLALRVGEPMLSIGGPAVTGTVAGRVLGPLDATRLVCPRGLCGPIVGPDPTHGVGQVPVVTLRVLEPCVADWLLAIVARVHADGARALRRAQEVASRMGDQRVQALRVTQLEQGATNRYRRAAPDEVRRVLAGLPRLT